MQGVLMANGEVFNGDRISELTSFIINKFAEKELSVDEAKIVLDHTKDVIGEYSTVKPIDL